MRAPRGFTLIEVVIALLLGSILTGIALTSYGNAQGRFAVRGARNTFTSLHARARATAIERGTTVRLVIDVAGDSIMITRGATTVEKIRFEDEFHVDIQSGSGNLLLCMNARGYADTGCTNFSSAVTVTFRQNADTASVRILPLGQLIF
ncbi:MAG TPA: prepilin-type N-terminal cleavage/methylation domain-containing protein [Longimicrobiales bacterium]|nr:prepilin-type N-terminal cleavage/methylation domain-containing protein [Longimicrobiales bacterium]